MSNSFIANALPNSVGGALLSVPILLFGFQVLNWIYNIWFHPLRKFPGPLASRASALPYIRQNLNGDSIFWTIKLHEKYGEVVRFTPNQLSFSGADAYRDLYGFKKAGNASLQKDPDFYINPSSEVRDLINSNDEDHARMRRIFSNAFSDRALKLQEPLFLVHIDKLVSKIREGPGKKQNLVQLYNFTTFDIMGDLTFGEPLGMLDDSSYHPWVAAIISSFRFGVYLHSIRYFPAVEALLTKYCIPRSLREKMKLHKEFSVQRVDRRLEKVDARPDIWGLVLEKVQYHGLSREEMYTNADLFMLAGTETTATLLSGLTFHLLASPTKLETLTREIRSAFAQEEEITVERLQALRYLNACLEEGLRMYPPVAQGLPRKCPPGAPTIVDGHQVPAGSTVQVSNLAAFRNPNNFRDPYAFVPERWLTDLPEGALFLHDKKHAFQPFSLGPRACLGKNMAYHEMRLILTKLLFNFDLALCEESRQWIDQKIFIMWDKPQLFVQFQPRID
ncbi:Putative cytochrome P450 [Septoria linicola]|uniref:Cytochrome P450 n=1 Tax=Septoria linicola TaxID=215465 RepID=A0A9Q9EL45_9PEZI|nr:putative cytochrome P450 [Septoria linicola]USW54720.1 Putative cytochrome P450 [Septoria linicola]